LCFVQIYSIFVFVPFFEIIYPLLKVPIACQPLADKSALTAASFCAYPEEHEILGFDASFKFCIFALSPDN